MKMLRRIITIGTCCSLPMLLIACGNSSTTQGESEAAKTLSSSLKASVAKGTMHVVAVTTNGKQVQTVSADIGTDSASETIRNSSGGGEVNIIVSGGIAYVQASPSTLQDLLGLTVAASTSAAGQWISVTSSDPPFQLIDHSLTIDAAVNPYLPSPSSAVLKPARHVKGIDGTVQPVTGTYNDSGAAAHVSGVASTFINTGTNLLQGGSFQSASKNPFVTTLAVYSKWGVPVSVTAPTSSLSYKTLFSQ
jgi:hypothetical protein